MEKKIKIKWTYKKLYTLCDEFSLGITNGQSRGNSAKVCFALQGYLSWLGLNSEIYVSEVNNSYHLWLKTKDNQIIDCTADQHNTKKKTYPRVHIGKPLDIHRKGKLYEDFLKELNLL